MIVSFNELSSAELDLTDVVESLRRSRGERCLGEVQEFLASLYPPSYPHEDYEGHAEVDVDPARLQSCLGQMQAFSESLDRRTKMQPKDGDGGETTIGDCIEEVLAFLKSLS